MCQRHPAGSEAEQRRPRTWAHLLLAVLLATGPQGCKPWPRWEGSEESQQLRECWSLVSSVPKSETGPQAWRYWEVVGL